MQQQQRARGQWQNAAVRVNGSRRRQLRAEKSRFCRIQKLTNLSVQVKDDHFVYLYDIEDVSGSQLN